MNTILGIDPGVSNIGLALINPKSLSIIHTELYSIKDYPSLFSDFRGFLTIHEPSKVAIEKPFFSPQTIGKNTRTLEAIGIQKLVCELENIKYEVYAPATIKKQITGNGRANKDLVIQNIKQIFNFPTEITHIADAIAIAYTDYLNN